MNICVVSQQVRKTFSGVGLYTHNYVEHLLRDGHTVWLLTSEDQRPEGSLPYTLVTVPSPVMKKNQARWMALSVHFARALKALEQHVRLDFVHFTDARESLFYRTRLPVVGNINDTYSAELHSLSYYRRNYTDWLQRSLYYVLVHLAEGIALRKLDGVIANSQFTGRMILNQYRVKPEKLFVCYKSVNTDIYRAARMRPKMQENSPRKILFVGTNMQRKGLPAVIHAAPAILNEFPRTEFWVVGEDKSVPSMKALCAQEGVLGDFHFTGWKSQVELSEVYAQSDLFVMPSLTEAFGVVFLEAMAAGLVVVSARVGGIPEIIRHEENGLLIDRPEDAVNLAYQVKRVLRDPQFFFALQKEGFTTAESFNVRRMVECTYQVYREVSVG